mmetsp:Transcript_18116/g.28070  ORF Transcript_18116/g.28070 Transcript_18116/m.28070 type:complete len:233 (-) Transcript_18116:967-1665(-)
MALRFALGQGPISGHIQRCSIRLLKQSYGFTHRFRLVHTAGKAHQPRPSRPFGQAVTGLAPDLDQQGIDLLARGFLLLSHRIFLLRPATAASLFGRPKTCALTRTFRNAIFQTPPARDHETTVPRPDTSLRPGCRTSGGSSGRRHSYQVLLSSIARCKPIARSLNADPRQTRSTRSALTDTSGCSAAVSVGNRIAQTNRAARSGAFCRLRRRLDYRQMQSHPEPAASQSRAR